MEAAKQKAAPLYKEVEDIGDLDPLYAKPSEKMPTGKLNKEQAEAILRQELGISPSPEYTSNISSIGKFINSDDVFADAVKSVKRAYSSLKGLPDTDARVVLDARKLLSKQTISSDPICV